MNGHIVLFTSIYNQRLYKHRSCRTLSLFDRATLVTGPVCIYIKPNTGSYAQANQVSSNEIAEQFKESWILHTAAACMLNPATSEFS